jgi:hypothetical protein
VMAADVVVVVVCASVMRSIVVIVHAVPSIASSTRRAVGRTASREVSVAAVPTWFSALACDPRTRHDFRGTRPWVTSPAAIVRAPPRRAPPGMHPGGGR